jgi:hypothetical protein
MAGLVPAIHAFCSTRHQDVVARGERGNDVTKVPRNKSYAVFCSLKPSSLIVSSRMMNFCTLPVTVIGNASTNLM